MSIPRFGVTNPVPVNLLMAGLIIGGVVAASKLTREFFPEITPESVQITLPYPGATPQEIEETLAMKVEDALAELDEIDRLTTTLSEGGGGIIAEFASGVDDTQKAVDEVERAIDSLTDLPEEAEEIRVSEFEPRLPVIMISLYGQADEETMKRGLRRIRDDLKTLPGMGELLTSGVRDYEIRVDVSAAALLEHRLSLPQVAEAIRNWMADVPGGSVRTGAGDVRVRTMGVPERAGDIRGIIIKATPQGQVLALGDIAEVREDYVDEQLITRFNGEPSVTLTVFKTGNQDAVRIAEMARAYVAGRRGDPFQARLVDRVYSLLNGSAPPEQRAAGALVSPRLRAYDLGRMCPEPLPGGLATHSDLARFIEGRLDLLLRNARWGAMLVFGTLLLFLNWRVAMWVGAGLVIALSGTLILMTVLGITLNLLTMFGLIVVLGLLVDDAIVVAENIQARHDRKEPSLVAAIKGTEQVFWPVVATVLTSIFAFLPLRFIQGQIGDLIGALPVVVACALALSLVESLLILPSHMGHSLLRRDRSRPGRIAGRIRRFETWRALVGEIHHHVLGAAVLADHPAPRAIGVAADDDGLVADAGEHVEGDVLRALPVIVGAKAIDADGGLDVVGGDVDRRVAGSEVVGDPADAGKDAEIALGRDAVWRITKHGVGDLALDRHHDQLILVVLERANLAEQRGRQREGRKCSERRWSEESWVHRAPPYRCGGAV